MLGDDLEGCDGAGWREVQEGGDIYTYIYIYMCVTDSLSCTAGTNRTLKSNYTPIKKIKYHRHVVNNRNLFSHSSVG